MENNCENDNCKCYNFFCVETKLLIQSRVLFFTPDPIELFEKATTCEEQIANLRYFYELCKDWNEQHM